jgi:tRNA (guanine-N7-)-methyltransferase
VEELHKWHVEKCTAHPHFVRLDDDEVLQNDPAVKAMLEETEEGKKVARLGGRKYFAVFRRLSEAELASPKILTLWES